MAYMNTTGCWFKTHLFCFLWGTRWSEYLPCTHSCLLSFLVLFRCLVYCFRHSLWVCKPEKKSDRSDRSPEHGSKQDVCWWQLSRMTYFNLVLLRKASYSAFVNHQLYIRREKWVRQAAGMAQQAATWLNDFTEGEERCVYMTRCC